MTYIIHALGTTRVALLPLFFFFFLKCDICLSAFLLLSVSSIQLLKGTMPPPAAGNLGYTPPDGGWGWAVVFGAFISIGFSYAFPKSLTIYYKEIQEYFSVSYSQIAWVSSVMLASMYAGGEWGNLEPEQQTWSQAAAEISLFFSPLPRTLEQHTCESLWQQTCGYGRRGHGQRWNADSFLWYLYRSSLPLHRSDFR